MTVESSFVNKQSDARMDWIDMAKGLGMLLVAIGHLLPEGSNIRMFIYSFHMPLFFVLSGIVYKNTSSSGFFKSRLFVSYLFFSVTFVIADLLVRVLLLGKYEPSSIIWEVYQTISFYGINVLWFVSTIILCKWIMGKLLLIKNKLAIIGMVGVLFILTGWIGTFYTMSSESYSIIRLALYFPILAILRPLNVLIFYVIGYFSKKYIIQVIQNRNTTGLVAIGVLILIIVWGLTPYCGNVDVHIMTYENIVLALFTGLSGSVAIIFICSFFQKCFTLTAYLRFCGKNSILFMVLHEYLFMSLIVNLILSAVHINNIILYIVGTIILTSLIIYIIKDQVDYCLEYLSNKFLGNNIKTRS
ncbi:acyltransferase family protein [Neobacillus drentensis]|uniref:acyltransferase family protein n=1 Tax=Neobacillus drentensis TaxID=220684 RepID=UPI002FFF710D